MADRIRIPFRWWFERFATIVRESAHYRRQRADTAIEQQAGPPPLLLRSVVCAAVGHAWPAPNGAITLAPWLFSFCSRCNEELCGRASIEQLEYRPIDDWDAIDDAWRYDIEPLDARRYLGPLA